MFENSAFFPPFIFKKDSSLSLNILTRYSWKNAPVLPTLLVTSFSGYSVPRLVILTKRLLRLEYLEAAVPPPPREREVPGEGASPVKPGRGNYPTGERETLATICHPSFGCLALFCYTSSGALLMLC